MEGPKPNKMITQVLIITVTIIYVKMKKIKLHDFSQKSLKRWISTFLNQHNPTTKLSTPCTFPAHVQNPRQNLIHQHPSYQQKIPLCVVMDFTGCHAHTHTHIPQPHTAIRRVSKALVSSSTSPSNSCTKALRNVAVDQNAEGRQGG